MMSAAYIQDFKKIEQIQHAAARIVKELPNFSSFYSLYFETGWELYFQEDALPDRKVA